MPRKKNSVREDFVQTSLNMRKDIRQRVEKLAKEYGNSISGMIMILMMTGLKAFERLNGTENS